MNMHLEGLGQCLARPARLTQQLRGGEGTAPPAGCLGVLDPRIWCTTLMKTCSQLTESILRLMNSPTPSTGCGVLDPGIWRPTARSGGSGTYRGGKGRTGRRRSVAMAPSVGPDLRRRGGSWAIREM
eukprot:COSAG01_NODE_470_length_16575_cov_5.572408_23_plen_127_part_00